MKDVRGSLVLSRFRQQNQEGDRNMKPLPASENHELFLNGQLHGVLKCKSSIKSSSETIHRHFL